MNFCPNCGQQTNGNFCTNCGTNLATNNNQMNSQPMYNNQMPNQPMYNNQPNTQMYPNQMNAPVQKNGKAVASLVLGIIAIIWALFEVLAFGDVSNNVAPDGTISNVAYGIAFFIGFNILSFPCGLIGLILGLKSKHVGTGKAGLILSAIALLVCVISAFVIAFAL